MPAATPSSSSTIIRKTGTPPFSVKTGNGTQPTPNLASSRPSNVRTFAVGAKTASEGSNPNTSAARKPPTKKSVAPKRRNSAAEKSVTVRTSSLNPSAFHMGMIEDSMSWDIITEHCTATHDAWAPTTHKLDQASFDRILAHPMVIRREAANNGRVPESSVSHSIPFAYVTCENTEFVVATFNILDRQTREVRIHWPMSKKSEVLEKREVVYESDVSDDETNGPSAKQASTGASTSGATTSNASLPIVIAKPQAPVSAPQPKPAPKVIASNSTAPRNAMVPAPKPATQTPWDQAAEADAARQHDIFLSNSPAPPSRSGLALTIGIHDKKLTKMENELKQKDIEIEALKNGQKEMQDIINNIMMELAQMRLHREQNVDVGGV